MTSKTKKTIAIGLGVAALIYFVSKAKNSSSVPSSGPAAYTPGEAIPYTPVYETTPNPNAGTIDAGKLGVFAVNGFGSTASKFFI